MRVHLLVADSAGAVLYWDDVQVRRWTPTASPTASPTSLPTVMPTISPTASPTSLPTTMPTTARPTTSPTTSLTNSPTTSITSATNEGSGVGSSGLSTGIIAGVIVAVVVAFAVGIYVGRRRNGQRHQMHAGPPQLQTQNTMFTNPMHQVYESPVHTNPDYVATDGGTDVAAAYEEPVALSPAYHGVRTNRIALDAENYALSPPQLAVSVYARPGELTLRDNEYDNIDA
jgi:hypothetical protein